LYKIIVASEASKLMGLLRLLMFRALTAAGFKFWSTVSPEW